MKTLKTYPKTKNKQNPRDCQKKRTKSLSKRAIPLGLNIKSSNQIGEHYLEIKINHLKHWQESISKF